MYWGKKDKDKKLTNNMLIKEHLMLSQKFERNKKYESISKAVDNNIAYYVIKKIGMYSTFSIRNLNFITGNHVSLGFASSITRSWRMA